MDTQDLFPESKYLKSEDVEQAGGELLLTVTSVARKEYTDEASGKKEVKGELTFQEVEKKMALNVTNTNVMASMFGSKDIDKAWIGKQVTLYVDHNVKYGTKIVSGLRIRLVDPKQDMVKKFWDAAYKMGLTNIEGQAIVKENKGDFVAAFAALDSPF